MSDTLQRCTWCDSSDLYRHAWRGRGGVLTNLAHNLGYRACKRGVQHSAALFDPCGVEPGLRLRYIGLRSVAAGALGLCFGTSLLFARARHKALAA